MCIENKKNTENLNSNCNLTSTIASLEKIELCTPGTLGTCWYGKYHYLEPLVGCAHNCSYCYARSRPIVKNSLKDNHTTFHQPRLIMEREKLLTEIKKISSAEHPLKVKTVKLSRYTDIFSPPLVNDGTAYEILKIMAQGDINRIIITTKGIPDKKIISLMGTYPQKFSYNAVAKPECVVKFEQNVASVEERLLVAAQVESLGIKTTIHMDPLIPGIEDQIFEMEAFLKKLKQHNLKRVMFSYLLLNTEIIKEFNHLFSREINNKIYSQYYQQEIQMLPQQPESSYIDLLPEVKQKSVEGIVNLLQALEFDYVLCSLKSNKESLRLAHKSCKCNICDGAFYA